MTQQEMAWTDRTGCASFGESGGAGRVFDRFIRALGEVGSARERMTP